MSEELQKSLAPIVRWGVHVVLGAVVFALIALGAYGLGELAKLLKSHGMAENYLCLLEAVESLTFQLDVLGYVLVLIEAFAEAARPFLGRFNH